MLNVRRKIYNINLLEVFQISSFRAVLLSVFLLTHNTEEFFYYNHHTLPHFDWSFWTALYVVHHLLKATFCCDNCRL
jgi:hypothetical protein